MQTKPATKRVQTCRHLSVGRLISFKAAGVRYVISTVDTMRRVDLRTVTLDVPQRPVGFGVPRLAEWRFSLPTSTSIEHE